MRLNERGFGMTSHNESQVFWDSVGQGSDLLALELKEFRSQDAAAVIDAHEDPRALAQGLLSAAVMLLMSAVHMSPPPPVTSPSGLLRMDTSALIALARKNAEELPGITWD